MKDTALISIRPITKILSFSVISFLFFQHLLWSRITYKANQVEIKNITENGKKSELIIMTGNAVLTDYPNLITANKIIYRKAEKTAEAKNRVLLSNKEEGVTIKSGYLFYDIKNKYATIEKAYSSEIKQPSLYSKKDNVTITGKSMFRSFESNYCGVLTNVYIKQDNSTNITESYSDFAYFYGELDIIRLTNQCKVLRTDMNSYSESIILYTKKNFISFINNVKIDLLDKSSTNIVYADYVNYDFADQKKDIYCYTNVKVLELKENIEINSQYLYYNIVTGYSYIEGNPVLIDHKNNTKTSSVTMERFTNSQLLYAKGNVHIQNKNREAFSDFAIYDGLQKKIRLVGDPSLKRDNNLFKAEIIEFDIEKNEVYMLNNVTGGLIAE